MKYPVNTPTGIRVKETRTSTIHRLRRKFAGFLCVSLPFAMIGVADAGSLSGSVTPTGIGSNQTGPTNLTALGASDWAHWGRAANYNNFDHKALGGAQISNKSTFGTAGQIHTGAYNNSSRYCTWTDGAPTASATDRGCIYENGNTNTGFQFTAPADTNSRTLYVWCGGDGAVLQLSAHLSDGSAPDLVFPDQIKTDIDGNPITGVFNRLFQMDYQADSAAQTLTIMLTKVGDAYNPTNPYNQGSLDLWAAWLFGPPPPFLPPTVGITAPTNGTIFPSGPTDITITATATGNPAPVTNVDFYAGSTLIGSDNTSPYSLVWSNATPGTYLLTAKATDNMGFQSVSSAIEIGVVGTGGQVGGAVTPLANTTNSFNLSDLGRSDWGHWGRGGLYSSFQQKGSGGRQISNVTPVGTGEAHGGATDPSRLVSAWNSWPTTTRVIDDPGYIYGNGATNTGFSFTAPADTTLRTLYVYCGGSSNTTTTLRAHLSDFSASDYVDSQVNTNDQYMGLYAITYQAGNAGQTLKITLLKTDDPQGGGRVALKAAWLIMGPPNTLPAVAFASPANNANFSAGANIELTATASDSDGTVSNVAYYVGSVLVGSADTSPYSVTWSNAPTGRYILRASATDNLGGVRISAPITVVVGGGGTTPVSDDFNSPAFNGWLWATMDGARGPIGTSSWGTSAGYGTVAGGATFGTVGAYSGNAYALINAPGGRDSDCWDLNESVFMLQAVANQDFEVEAKFNTAGVVTSSDCSEGFLVESDAGTGMRFDILDQNGVVKFYSASGIGSGTSATITFVGSGLGIPPATANSGGGPAYLKLARQGDNWICSTSPDGTNWTERANTTQSGFVPARLGIFVINYNGSTALPPAAFPVQVDYFMNTASPIVPEDVPYTLRIDQAGNQAVLSWASALSGFVLEQTPSLSPPSWSEVTNAIVVVGDQNTVTVDPTNSASFYRLRR